MPRHYLVSQPYFPHPPDSSSLPLCDAKARIEVYNLRQRNCQVAPISRLPPEILATIFVYCAHDYYYENQDFYSSTGVAHWVNISYVCHYWRNVALDCPTLWTYHFTVSLRWTEELLARSKQALLKICLIYNFTSQGLLWTGLLEKLKNHTERIQELKLSLPGRLLPTWQFFLHAPRLQSLILGVNGEVDSWSPDLFGRNVPPLRTLELSRCGVSWCSLVFNGLTTLSLRRIPPGSQQTLVEFRAVLSRMQNLAVLQLDDALADTHGSLSYELLPKIVLPHLVRLTVAAPLSTVVAFLSCIGIPLKTHVCLDILSHVSSMDGFAPMCHLLAQRLSNCNDPASSNPVIRSLFIHSDLEVPTLAFNTLERTTCEDWSSNTPLEVKFSLDKRTMEEEDVDNIIRDVCCSLPLTNIQSLHIEDPPFWPDFWEKVTGHLRGLRHMKVSGGRMPNLISVLSTLESVELDLDESSASEHDPVDDPDNDCDSESVGHVFLPKLEALEFERINFSRGFLRNVPRSALFDAISTRGTLQDRVTMVECKEYMEGALVDLDRDWLVPSCARHD